MSNQPVVLTPKNPLRVATNQDTVEYILTVQEDGSLLIRHTDPIKGDGDGIWASNLDNDTLLVVVDR